MGDHSTAETVPSVPVLQGPDELDRFKNKHNPLVS